MDHTTLPNARLEAVSNPDHQMQNFNGFGSTLNKLSCDKLRYTLAWRDCIFMGLRFGFFLEIIGTILLVYLLVGAGVEFVAMRGAPALVESERPMAGAEMIPRPLIEPLIPRPLTQPAPTAVLWGDDL